MGGLSTQRPVFIEEPDEDVCAGLSSRHQCAKVSRFIYSPYRVDDRARTIVAGMSDLNNESVATIETTLNNVDRVLERLRVGTYRTCQVCTTPIDDAELAASPLLANCPAHPELA